MSALKILLVDDEYGARRKLQVFLKPYGQIDEAEDGAQALEKVDQALAAGEPYTMICLDIKMPNMDGQTALRKIRECEQTHHKQRAQGAKIIMITTVDDIDSVIKSFENECEAFIVKPFTKQYVLEQMAKLGLSPQEKT